MDIRYLVVHDINPAIAGAIAHLFQVAFDTPIFQSKVKAKLKVVVLGKYDLETPLVAEVVSEESSIEKFETDQHLSKTFGVASLTGCNSDELLKSGLIEEMVPIVALSLFSHHAKLSHLVASEKPTSDYVVSASDVHAVYQKTSRQLNGRLAEIVYLADCVFGCCNLIMDSATTEKKSIFK